MHELKDTDIVINRPREGEFYILRVDTRGGGRGHGVVFENLDELLTPPTRYLRPSSGGFPKFNEVPRLRQSRRQDFPMDLDSDFGGYWLVSEPLKQVFESVDPEGFAFAACDFFLEDGSPEPQHYLCDVLRTIDAVDADASKVKIEFDDDYPGGKYYNLSGGAKLAFKREVVGSAHVFWTPYTADVFCDRVLHDALIEHGFGKEPRTRGVWLEDAAAYSY